MTLRSQPQRKRNQRLNVSTRSDCRQQHTHVKALPAMRNLANIQQQFQSVSR
jgi:hypothetical protein